MTSFRARQRSPHGRTLRAMAPWRQAYAAQSRRMTRDHLDWCHHTRMRSKRKTSAASAISSRQGWCWRSCTMADVAQTRLLKAFCVTAGRQIGRCGARAVSRFRLQPRFRAGLTTPPTGSDGLIGTRGKLARNWRRTRHPENRRLGHDGAENGRSKPPARLFGPTSRRPPGTPPRWPSRAQGTTIPGDCQVSTALATSARPIAGGLASVKLG